jgi:hypothetical protein
MKQQVDRLAERQAPHHLVERIAADDDLVRLDAGERRAPLLVLSAASAHAALDAGWLIRLHTRVVFGRSPRPGRTRAS